MSQIRLPVQSRCQRLAAWVAGELAHRANPLGRQQVGGWCDWYSVKDAALRRWGWRDGWDLQLFRCWGEPGLSCGTECDRCGGSGIHRAVKLLRWRLGRQSFHQPAAAIVLSPAVSLHTDVGMRSLADAIYGHGRIFDGRIRHGSRRGGYLCAWLLLLWVNPSARRSALRSARVWDWLVRKRRSTAWWIGDLFNSVRCLATGYRIVGDSFQLPGLFRCPECGARLVAEINQRALDGIIRDGDFSLHCEADTGDGHRWWQSEWQPVISKAEVWMRKRVRRCRYFAEPDVPVLDGDIPF